MSLAELSPAHVHEALSRQEITLVDVREDSEFAAERIAGAICAPLSRFNPATLPSGVRLVLSCGAGRRSAAAAAQCAKAGIAIEGHLSGGLAAWKHAGLPTIT